MSSSILDLIKSQLGDQGVAALSQKLGAGQNETKNAIGAALPVLLGALARKGNDPDGAAGINAALERDDHASIFDNLGSLLGGSAGGKAADGSGILKHILGPKKAAVESGLAQTSGLNSGQVGDLLGKLAPMVMGALGKKKQEQGLDAGGLGALLGQERKQVEKQTGGGNLITGLLDQDGDGDVDLGDLAKGLGGLFG